MDDTTHIKDWHFSRRIFLKGGVLAALSGAAYEGLSNWSSQVSIAGANTPNPVHGRLRSDTAAPGQMNPTGAPGLGPGGKLLLPGSRPFPNVPAGEDMIPQIDHIVVLMMENHSFDDHLGMLGRGDGLTLGPDKLPINYNPNPKGGFIRSFRMPSTFMPQSDGVTQSWTASHKSWDNGTNAGFVAACSPVAMGYWTGEDIPFYYGLAGTFPIGDRYFCSVMAQTYPNRRFLIAATALGNIDTDLSGVAFTGFPNGSIFDTLDSYQISWKDYAYDLPTCALDFPVFQRAQKNGQISTIEQFVVDCSRGTLPSFCIVDPSSQFEGSEESGDIAVGEGYSAAVTNALMGSPAWPRTLLVWTYDEHGGFYDHVPPVPAVLPDNVPANYKHDGPDAPAGNYDYTGFRVPNCVVSAWSKKNFVSHQTYDHTSILKLVETKWNLPALTYRDANANNMLDYLDLTAKTPPFIEPPDLPAPTNQFTGMVSTDLTAPPLSQFPPRQAVWKSVPSGTDALLGNHRRAHNY